MAVGATAAVAVGLAVVTELADRAGRSRERIVGQLNTVRDAARWFGPLTAAAGGVLMAGCAAGIVWLTGAACGERAS